MADNIGNDIRTGFDKDTLFNLDLDTSKRMDSILNIPAKDTGVQMSSPMNNAVYKGNYNPEAYTQPQQTEATAPSLQNLPEGMSLGQALISDNPKLQDIAATTMQKKFNADPYYKFGQGTRIETPYDQGSKFLDKKFGYDALTPNIEDYYYKNEYMQDGWLSRNLVKNPIRFLGRVAGGTVAKLGEGLGYTGALIGSIGSDNYFQSVADNAFSKFFEQKEQWWKDQVIPVYKQAGFDEKGFFSKLGDWSFWNESVSDGVAFMTAATLQTLATGGLGSAVGLGELGEVGINMAARLGKLGKVLDFGAKTLTGAEDLGGIANWALNTTSESAFEATGVFKDTLADLKSKRENGEGGYTDKTDKELEAIAGRRAAQDFKGNMVILSLSNAFENKFIFQPLKAKIFGKPRLESIGNTKITLNDFTDDVETSLRAAKKEYNYATKAGKLFNWKDPQSRLRFYGLRSLEATAMEGFYEENTQLAIERLSKQGAYNDKGTMAAAWETIKQSGAQIKAAAKGKDQEAAESIGLGGVIGIAGGSVMAKIAGGKGLKGERRSEIEHAKNMIDEYNTNRREFLSLNDIYKKDENGVHLRDEVGGFIEDEEKVKARAEGLSEYTKRQVTGDQISDPVMKRLYQDDLFSDYIHAASRAGIMPAVLRRFDSLHSKSPEEIMALGFNPAEMSDANAFAQTAKDLAKIHEDSFNSSVKRPSNVSFKDYQKTEPARQYLLYKARSIQLANDKAYRMVDDAVSSEDVQNLPSPFSDNALQQDPLVQRYNSLGRQRGILIGFDHVTSENTDFYKEYVDSRSKEIESEMTEIKEALKDHLDKKDLFEFNNFLVTAKALKKTNDKTPADIISTNRMAHAGFINSREQWAYVADKISHPTDGHKNYLEYRDYQTKVALRDAEENAKTAPAAPTENKPPAPPPPPTPVNKILTPEQSIEAKREAELKKLNQWDLASKMEGNSEPETYAFNGEEHPDKASAEEAIKKHYDEEVAKLKRNGSANDAIKQRVSKSLNQLFQGEGIGQDEIAEIQANLAIAEPIIQAYLDTLLKPGITLETLDEATQDKLNDFAIALEDIYPGEEDEEGNVSVNPNYTKWEEQIQNFFKNPVEEVLTPEQQLQKDRQEELEKLPFTEDQKQILQFAKQKDPERYLRELKKLAAKSIEGQKILDRHEAEDTLTDKNASTEKKIMASMFIEDNTRPFTAAQESDLGKTVKDILHTLETYTHITSPGQNDVLPHLLKILKSSDKKEDNLLADKIEGILSIHQPLEKNSQYRGTYRGETIYGDTQQEVIDKINTKHNDELAKLNPEPETKEQAIERRRQAELKSIDDETRFSVLISKYGLKDFGSPQENVKRMAKEVVNKKYDDELAALKGPKDPISDTEYKDFVDNNKVSQKRLEDLANKIINNEVFSPREQAIMAGKTAEINDIIKAIKAKEEEEERKRNRLKNAQPVYENNTINSLIDAAKKNGEYTFVSSSLEEVEKVENGIVLLKTINDGNALRAHNFLRNQEFLGGSEYRVQLVNQDEDTAKFHYRVKNAKGPIAVIVNDKGEKVLFDQEGNPSATGLPISFQYSVNEYTNPNINKTRKEFFNNSKGTLEHGFVNEHPLMTMNVAINKGIGVYGKVHFALNGKLSAGNSDNSLGQASSTPNVYRTMEQMIKDGHISEDPGVLTSGQENMFVESAQIAGGALKSQMVKVGQPIIIDEKSGLTISFNGVKLRNLTVSKNNTFFSQFIDSLDERDGKIEMGNPDEAQVMYEFLRQVMYSEKIGIKIDPENPSAVLYDIKVNPDGHSLADEQINFNDADFQTQTIFVPGEKDPIEYISFVRKNFVSGAAPAKVSEGVTRFEKLNKRIIFTLDKKQDEMLSDIDKVTKKVTDPNNIKQEPDEASVEQFNNTSKISKELFADIMSEKDSVNIEELDFGCP